MSEGTPRRGPDPAEDVFDRIADAVFALDEDWRFTFLNEHAEELLERSEEELLGQVVWDEFPEAVDSTFQRQYEQAMRTQRPVAFEEYYPPLDTWFEVRAYPSPTGLSVHFHDVTDRVERHRRLRERERALRDAYEVVGDPDRSSAAKIRDLLEVARGVVDTPYGLLSRLEPSRGCYVVEAVSGPASGGIEVGDTLGLDAVPCCHDVFREEHTLVLEDVADQASHLVHETLGVAAYLGTPVTVDGEPYGTFCFFAREARTRPFTDWQVTYVKLLGRWTSSELERAQRTSELRQSNARLEASNRRMERFTRAASHDMQEPARTIATHLQLLRERHGEALGEEGREHLDFAFHSARRMRAMVRGLLAYAQGEAEELRFEPVDLDEVLADILTDKAAEIRAREATVTVGDLPTVEGDRSQLTQLFDHLLDNAIRYSGDERPRVHVEADRADGGWKVAVEDEGVGIESAYHQRVFDLFERLEGPSGSPAAGLGLAVCERIVERHGGEIWVDSEQGEGSRFTVRLPTGGPPSAQAPPTWERGSLVWD